MQSKRIVLLSFVILGLNLLSACVVQRSVVRQPELALHVTDGTSPLADVSVYLYWISNPYNRLEQMQTFLTDEEGNLRLEQRLQSDTAYPLALHGVTYFEHTLCLEASGYRTLLVTVVVLPGEVLNLETPLTPGQSAQICSSYDTLNNHSGVSRPDVTRQQQSIRGAYEVTP
jgi:hypothetical protein